MSYDPSIRTADGVLPLHLSSIQSVAGVFILVADAVGHRIHVFRPASASDDSCMLPLPNPELRSTSQMGKALSAIRIAWNAVAALQTDFDLMLWQDPLPATGYNAMAPAIDVFGTCSGVTYDTDHDAAAKRKVVGDHVMQINFDDPFYMTAGQLYLEILVSDAGNMAPGNLTILGVELLYSELQRD